ncbi:DUF4476 domain-containing protein [Bernardetia litoralis]|nr:DUF4476 domain-containing protein [Bernardetia litoralis]
MMKFILCALALSFCLFSCTIRTSENGEEVTIDFDGEKLAQNLEETNLALLKAEMGCESVMTNTDLDEILEKLDGTWFDKNKLDAAKERIQKANQCINIYQVISIIDYVPVSDRFEFARFAYGRTIDKEKFSKVEAYLENENEKKKLQSLYQHEKTATRQIGNRPLNAEDEKMERVVLEDSSEETEELTVEETETTITSSCTSPSLSDVEFDELVDYISEGHMAKDKLDRAKHSLKEACLSVNQVIDITEIINFPDEQVIFAKFAFSRTVDTENFCSVKSVLIYPAPKASLTRFLKRKNITCRASTMEKMMDDM